MQSSPPYSEGKARAIRELSQSLNHSQRSLSSAHSAPSDSNPTKRSGFGDSSTKDWFNDPDVLMSTQHNLDELTNTNTLPKYPPIRSTAKKFNSWTMPQSEPNPDTSMVNKQFGDFDHSYSDDEVESIEQARGEPDSNRGTPVKISSRGFNSLYDITPPTARSRKSYAAESGSLRRDAQIRRASRNDMENGASPRPGSTRNSPALPSKQERKRASLAQLHAKLSEDESSFMQERPPSATYQHSANTRWGNSRSRQSSLQIDGNVDALNISGTPRSRPGTAQNPTAQSFILPDLPNLTELVSGIFEDGTPVFSKNAPARSRFAAASGRGGNGGRQPSHIPVDSVPIPQDEKAIFAALQLLQDKVAQMEHERAEHEKRIEDQELEILELKAAAQAQEKYRRSDSALGSTDGEGSGKASWKVEKTRLDATVQTLRTKLDRTERKFTVLEIEKKRLGAERDNMASQLGVAYQTCEELKTEKQALVTDNDALREKIDTLRAEVEHLRDELEQEQAQHREETVNLRRQVEQTENATQRQNITLQAELNRARAQQDEHTQQLARKEAELRKARQEKAEYAKLEADHDALKSQLASLKAKREADLRRWSDKEASLKEKVERRDETIRLFQDNTQEQTNEAMRLENERLREELAQEAAQHEQDNQQWVEREQELNRKIARRTLAARQNLDMTREILSMREANGQENAFRGQIQQKPSHFRDENTRTRIRNRVQEESRVTRANTSFPSSHIEESPRKSYVKIIRGSQRTSLPADTGRSVSAPLTQHKNVAEEVVSDAESTTDISLAPRGTSYEKRGGFAARPPTNTVQPPPDLEYTELSFISGAAVAELRRQLEEERAAIRGRAVSVPLERTVREDTGRSGKSARDQTIRSERNGREDTVRSIVSEKSVRQQSLPRKSSMKDTTKTNMTQFEEDFTGDVSKLDEANGEATQTKQSVIDASMLSNTSRRRRSAPTEMTSAFIIPDLTLGTRKHAAGKVDMAQMFTNKQHDNENCTVCRREASNENSDPLRVPKLVPVSSRMPDDVDATMRPARSPKEALALVVKTLRDERIHLHAELAVARALLESHDVSLGRKKRTAYENDIADLLAKIKIKDDQIYNLYDVLEDQQEGDITEQFVEEATEQIRAQDEEVEKKSREKRVTIQSFHEDNESMGGDDGSELPWEGFESTGEVTGQAGRIGVY